MTKSAHLHLPDGRILPYTIRSSRRNKTIRLRITLEGLSVSAPAWLRLPQVMAAVAGNSEWIASHLDRLEKSRQEIDNVSAGLPETFHLPALAEQWEVAYQVTMRRSVAARTDGNGKILLTGATGDDNLCRATLRQWLAGRASAALDEKIAALAEQTGLSYNRLRIRNQRTLWGSCTSAGTISLNCKLLFLTEELVRYVLLHELCHTREHNHTARFWALLLQHEPEALVLHRQIRAAWQLIPHWAHQPRR